MFSLLLLIYHYTDTQMNLSSNTLKPLDKKICNFTMLTISCNLRNSIFSIYAQMVYFFLKNPCENVPKIVSGIDWMKPN